MRFWPEITGTLLLLGAGAWSVRQEAGRASAREVAAHDLLRTASWVWDRWEGVYTDGQDTPALEHGPPPSVGLRGPEGRVADELLGTGIPGHLHIDSTTWSACLDPADAPPHMTQACTEVTRLAMAFPPPDPETGRALAPFYERGLGFGLNVPAVALWTSWFAPVESRDLDPSSARLVAASLGLWLGGCPLAPTPHRCVDEYVCSLHRTYTRMASSCGKGPAPMPVRTRQEPLPVHLETSRLTRARRPDQETGSPRAHRMSRIRRESPVPEETWTTPGTAGMASLELAMSEGEDALPRLLRVAEAGPTPTDRLAALYAALQAAPMETWPQGTAREKALRIRSLVVASASGG